MRTTNNYYYVSQRYIVRLVLCIPGTNVTGVVRLAVLFPAGLIAVTLNVYISHSDVFRAVIRSSLVIVMVVQEVLNIVIVVVLVLLVLISHTVTV